MKQLVINPLRIIVLMHHACIPPRSLKGHGNKEAQIWRTEYDVVKTLTRIGHEVHAVGISNDLRVIRRAARRHKPHIAFNLLEEFAGHPLYDQHVVSYLELIRMPYTGCNPLGLTLAHDKALTKKILAYHDIHVPRFIVFPPKWKARRPGRLKFPLIVKSLIDEGSIGIAHASVVRDDERLAERVNFIHEQTGKSALVEEYIEGREVYLGVIGNNKLQAYPPWELLLKDLPDGAPNIATYRVKWDVNYQQRAGVVTQAAELPDEMKQKMMRLSKRIYRLLGLSGYARIDYRLTADGRMYVLEVNPNPQIARGEDFADSAAKMGVRYEQLLQKIVALGLTYDPMSRI
ncbi:MAG TPA: ATP-grasp domain-containing protein [Pyrinomonadaceae bacterium]|jgi:D-alanine-D-alanine ligase